MTGRANGIRIVALWCILAQTVSTAVTAAQPTPVAAATYQDNRGYAQQHPRATATATHKPARRPAPHRLLPLHVTLAISPTRPVSSELLHMTATLGRPLNDGRVTITWRPTVPGLSSFSCTPVHGRCVGTWSTRDAGRVTIEAHWSGDRDYKPTSATLYVPVARTRYTYEGMWGRDRVGPLTSVEPAVVVPRLRDAHWSGRLTRFQTADPAYACLWGETLAVYTAPRDYPDEEVGYHPSHGARCAAGTWLFPQPAVIDGRQRIVGTPGAIITVHGVFPAPRPTASVIQFIVRGKLIATMPIRTWESRAVTTQVPSWIRPGVSELRLAWNDVLTDARVQSNTARARIIAPRRIRRPTATATAATGSLPRYTPLVAPPGQPTSIHSQPLPTATAKPNPPVAATATSVPPQPQPTTASNPNPPAPPIPSQVPPPPPTSVPAPSSTPNPPATFTTVPTTTSTATAIPTATSTAPSTPTDTSTATATPTSTPIPSATSVPPTLIATHTPSSTPTAPSIPLTATQAPVSPSPTASATATGSPTATATTASAPTVTATANPVATSTSGCTTTLPSSITTNMELAASPCSVYVSNGTTVQSGATLTVDPGVTIESSYAMLDIKGSLVAAGTASQPITFTSAQTTPTAGGWIGLTIEGTAALSYATVIYGGAYPTGCGCYAASVRAVSGGRASLDHASVTSSNEENIYADATSAVTVTNSTIASATYEGIDAQGQATIRGDVFSGNGGYAVELGAPNALATVSDNSFSGNNLNGVLVDGGTLTVPATLASADDGEVGLESALVVSTGTTLTVAPGETVAGYGGNASIVDVYGTLSAVGTASQPITFTDSRGDSSGWGGMVFRPGARGTLGYATVKYASTAVDVTGNATVSIHNSTIVNDGFGIYNCANCSRVQAQNNWWGTLTGPAGATLEGTGPGISTHEECSTDPFTDQTDCVTVPDVLVDPWVGETIFLRLQNGPSGNATSGPGSSGGGTSFGDNGSSPDGGCPYCGSANNDTVSTAEPVNTATGSYEYSHTDLSLTGRTPLVFTRSYNSRTAADSPGPLGYGWTFTYGISLTTSMSGSTPLVEVTFGSGRTDLFSRQSDGTYAATPDQFDTLTANADGTYDVADLHQMDYHFGGNGTLLSITNRNSNVTSLSYNGSGQLATVSVVGGRSLSFSYDGDGRITSVSDNSGRSVTFGYSLAGDLTSVTDPRGHATTYGYDGAHQLTSGVDRNGHAFANNSYDSLSAGRVISQTDALGNLTTFAYYPAGGTTIVADPRGATTTYTYDSNLRLTSVRDALSETTSYTYDNQGNRLMATDSNGHTTTYTYDSHGNMLTRTDPLGNVTTWTYDAHNQPLTVTDPMSRTTTNTYDAHENALTHTDALSRTVAYTYDSQGDMLTSTDPLSHTTTYGYDAAGDRTSVTDALGHATTTAYDGAGRPTSATDSLGHIVTTTYDADDNVPSVTDALGHTTTTTYDAEGNRTGVTDANGNTTSYGYDALNRLTSVTDALGHTTRYAYDAVGNRVNVTDALSHTTTTSYDLLNRVTGVTSPLTETVGYTYDAAGNLTAKTNARGHTITYGYDTDNRQTSVSYADGTNVAYTYNADGLRTSMKDATGTTTYGYDADNRVTSVAQPNGTVSDTYDAVGNRASMTAPGSKTTRYGYDADSRLASVTDWHGGVTTTSYDAAGRVSARGYANDVSATYSYDVADHLLGISYSSSGATLLGVSYTYDADGNRLTATDNGGTTTYTYDALNRLTRAQAPTGTTAYSYDGVGNRVSMTIPGGTTTYTYNAADELLSAGSTTYRYDADGNRIAATTGTSTTTYSYDDANYLTGISGNGQSVAYSYDGDHDRTGKEVGGTATSDVLDLATGLPTVVQEATASITTTYLYGGGLLAQDNGSGEQFLLPDGLGSTRQITNGSGSTIGSSAYDAYGAQTTSGTGSVFGFTGQQIDAESGLVYLRARYYDPSTGTFLQRDPFPANPFAPVTLNRYAYVHDTPTKLVDPSGLSANDPYGCTNWLCQAIYNSTGAQAAIDSNVAYYNGPSDPNVTDSQLEQLRTNSVQSTDNSYSTLSAIGEAVPYTSLNPGLGDFSIEDTGEVGAPIVPKVGTFIGDIVKHGGEAIFHGDAWSWSWFTQSSPSSSCNGGGAY